MEYPYPNSFKLTIGIAPYETLYGKLCQLSKYCYKAREKQLSGPKLVPDCADKVKLIRERDFLIDSSELIKRIVLTKEGAT